jgi:hypothetical protein
MTDIGNVSVEYLEKVDGIVGEFTTYLASNATRLGHYCALGFYRREEMEQMATEYIDLYRVTREEVDKLYGWIKALPWPKAGYLTLVFNWKGDE